jgi:hypothetical protein
MEPFMFDCFIVTALSSHCISTDNSTASPFKVVAAGPGAAELLGDISAGYSRLRPASWVGQDPLQARAVLARASLEREQGTP